jgi:hypothetical protein
MSAYVVTPLAKADTFDVWSYIAENSEIAAAALNRPSMMLARFWPKARCAATRPYGTYTPFLDTEPLSQLHRCLPA